MASASDFLETVLLNHVFRTAVLAKAANLFVALHTADPTDAGTGAEVPTSGTGYARQAVAVADLSWAVPYDAAGQQKTHNLVEITFPQATAPWGTPSHWALWDAVTGGNLWIHGPIGGTLRPVLASDDPVSFAPAALAVECGLQASDWFETAVLNHLLRTASLAKPANVYVALHSADPTDAALGTVEFAGGSYARVAVAVADAQWTAPAATGTDRYVANAAPITFPAPTAAWGTYTHVGIWTAASGGDLIVAMPTGASRTVNSNDNAPVFGAGELWIQAG